MMFHKPYRIPALRALSVIVGMLFAGMSVAHAEDDPLKDPVMQNTLRAMRDASTLYHPDLFGEYAGVRSYAHHRYAEAMKFFEVGAYYADKFSQLSIGLMYRNGEGVAQDPVKAYAWLDLAAERQYPDFVQTRDGVKAGLDADQMQRATALREELAARYGDAVAKPRMVTQLHLGQMQVTGSHTGFDSGVLHQSATGKDCNSGKTYGAGAPLAGCGGDYYARDRWDPKKYFAGRDAYWRATVTVGDLDASGQAASPAEKNQPPPPSPTPDR